MGLEIIIAKPSDKLPCNLVHYYTILVVDTSAFFFSAPPPRGGLVLVSIQGKGAI
jgi:hypothetical protein